MKKYSPYILPALVFAVVLLLVFRWYNNRTQPVPHGELFGEGVQIEDLSDQEARKINAGTSESIKTVQMVGADDTTEGTAMVRYEVTDDKVRFSVIADVPEPEKAYYVWLKEVDGNAIRQAFMLEAGKGGYVGSAALPANLLPFEVLISTSVDPQVALEQPLYTGTINKESAE